VALNFDEAMEGNGLRKRKAQRWLKRSKIIHSSTNPFNSKHKGNQMNKIFRTEATIIPTHAIPFHAIAP